MFNLSQQRRYERFEYALKLLDTPFDFTQPDNYIFDREGAAWPKDEAELNELWRQRVKFDALSLKLSGKEWPGSRNCLASVTTTPSSGCPRPRARTCSSSS